MSKSIQERQDDVSREIEQTFEALNAAKEEAAELKKELDAMQGDRSRFSLLSEITDLLDQLSRQGGADLFWGDLVSRDAQISHTEQVRKRVYEYDEEYNKIYDRFKEVDEKIESLVAKTNVLNETSETLAEVAEEAKFDFVIEREMVRQVFRPMIMPWTGNKEDERRFMMILGTSILFGIILSILIPLYEVPVPDRLEPVEVPERLAKLVVEKKPPPPKPKPEEKKPEEQKPTKKKQEATKKQTQVARKKASNAGLLAFSKNFSSMVDSGSSSKLGASARISSAGATAKKTTRSLVTAQAKGSSGGIQTAALSRDVGGAGQGIKGVAFDRVESAIGSDFFGEERPLSDGAGPSRTDEEIQIVFDRYKSALYRIYNKELRSNPTLQGKMVLVLTIEPNGTVSACKVESSDMDSATLDAKIVARVLRFNFGPKEGVPPLTIRYPIDFLPAS